MSWATQRFGPSLQAWASAFRVSGQAKAGESWKLCVVASALFMLVTCGLYVGLPSPEEWAFGWAVALALPLVVLLSLGGRALGPAYCYSSLVILWGGILGGGLLTEDASLLVFVLLCSTATLLTIAPPSPKYALLCVFLLPIPISGFGGIMEHQMALGLKLHGISSMALMGTLMAWTRAREDKAARALSQALKEAIALDPLTGVASRQETLSALRAALHRGGVSILYIDVDRFKSINDTWGHPCGDRVLAHLGASLRENLPPGGTVGRLGGEEFLMILPDSSEGEGRCMGERLIRPTLGAEEGADIPDYTLSIGVATACPGEGGRSLLARADNALYQAKREGRCRVVGALEAGASGGEEGPSFHEPFDEPMGEPIDAAILNKALLRRSIKSFKQLGLIGTILCLGCVWYVRYLGESAEEGLYQLITLLSMFAFAVANLEQMKRSPLAMVSFVVMVYQLILVGAWGLDIGPRPLIIAVSLTVPFMVALSFPFPSINAMAGLLTLGAFASFAFLSAGEALPWVSITSFCLLAILGALVQGVIRSHISMSSLEDDFRLRYLAQYDSLTGLLNRVTFLREAGAKGEGVLMYVDLDHFKAINDTHGHEAGDRVLREVGSLLRASAPEAALSGRLGGEELAIFIPGIGQESGVRVAEAILAQLRSLVILWGGRALRVRASVGVVEGGMLDEHLMLQADSALYRAKSQGRDQVVAGEAKLRAGRAALQTEGAAGDYLLEAFQLLRLDEGDPRVTH